MIRRSSCAADGYSANSEALDGYEDAGGELVEGVWPATVCSHARPDGGFFSLIDRQS